MGGTHRREDLEADDAEHDADAGHHPDELCPLLKIASRAYDFDENIFQGGSLFTLGRASHARARIAQGHRHGKGPQLRGVRVRIAQDRLRRSQSSRRRTHRHERVREPFFAGVRLLVVEGEVRRAQANRVAADEASVVDPLVAQKGSFGGAHVLERVAEAVLDDSRVEVGDGGIREHEIRGARSTDDRRVAVERIDLLAGAGLGNDEHGAVTQLDRSLGKEFGQTERFALGWVVAIAVVVHGSR